ncbi:MAG: translation initiation factor IF-2 [Candidatus Peribacteraceae bacterium]|jgi:translation initiation factor IF-2
MRLVQVAKALGMTGQQLRKELMQVNFGVKPTDREIPEGLAKGIVRFLATKYNLSVNAETIGLQPDTDEEEGGAEPAAAEGGEGADQAAGSAVQEGEKAAPGNAVGSIGVMSRESPTHAEALNVLRKLSLDDVSKEAIKREQKQMEHTKAERTEQRREAEVQRLAQKRPAGVAEVQEQIKKKEGVVLLPDAISVKELSEKLGVQVPRLIQTLMKNGIMATVTQSIDYDTAAIVAAEMGITVQREQRAAKAEDLLSRNLEELLKEDPENLVDRPPVVVVMGHVDHGKTALLDAIRQTNVVAQEAGGITQHIGAYQVEHAMSGSTEKKKITFLDTPGHEAFTAMRARGAQVTDIVILLVSAEEGVRATTIEAINHAKDAEVPIIAVISKIDKERADPEKVKGELAAQGLQPEEWGGTIPVILTSAVTKQGIPDLLDHILFIAEVQGFKANPQRSAVATVIESRLDSALGPLATVIINTGTLKLTDIFVCGQTMGRVRTMIEASGTRLDAVTPSGPARVSGFAGVPRVGDILQVVPSEREARSLLEAVQDQAGRARKRSFADLVSRLSEGKAAQLKVVLKADAQGSQEAITDALSKLTGEGGVNVKVIHGGVGTVTESDIMMAAASDGVVMAFHADVPPEVQKTAEREGVKVREYMILYELLDEVEALLKGLVEPVEEEKVLGHLEVRGVFFQKKNEQIVGGKVTDGTLKRVPFRLLRGGQVVGTGRISSLKHVDKDIKEAKEGSECGMRVESAVPVQEGDVLEAYSREFRKKEGA